MRDIGHAQEYLGPDAGRYHQAVAAGLDEYQRQDHVGLVARLSKRSHSSNRNDLIWEALEREFPEHKFIRSGNSRRMLVGNEYSIRVKKLNPYTMRPQNITTQAVLDFLYQSWKPLTLPGIDPPTNIDLGYTLTGITESALTVYFRCPCDEDSPQWLWPIDEATDESSAGEALPLPAPPSPPSVRPKTPQTEKPKEEPGAAPAL